MIEEDLQKMLVEAHTLQNQKQYVKALELYYKILDVQPKNWEVVRMLSGCYGDMHQWDDAIRTLRQALSHEPNVAPAHNMMANHLLSIGKHLEAGYHYRRALEIAPTLKDAIWNYALWQIAHGDKSKVIWRKGWLDYELAKGMGTRPKNHYSEEWPGCHLGPDARLYIKWEQGCGDTLMFARFVYWAKCTSGAHVILEVQEPLVSLLCMMPYVDEVVPWQPGGSFICEFDTHVSLMSLVHLSGAMPSDSNSIVNNYDLGIDLKVQKTSRTRPIIGVCNRGSANHSNDFNRSIDWDVSKNITCGIDADFQYLSPGDTPAGILPLNASDYLDTALVMKNLDAVVTVDTSVAHLAGVLSIPTIALIPCNPDFRWFYGREDTPWYPTMNLIRQKTFGLWDDAIETANKNLKGLFK